MALKTAMEQLRPGTRQILGEVDETNKMVWHEEAHKTTVLEDTLPDNARHSEPGHVVGTDVENRS